MGDLHALLRASRAPGLDLARLVTLVGQGWIKKAAIEVLYLGTVVMTTVPLYRCQALARLAWATVDSSPASTMGGSSFQRAGKDTSENALAASSDSLPSSDPEAVAASLHVPTKQQILDIFEMLPSDDPPRGQLQAGSKAFTVGSYAVGGGLLGVRKATRSYPEVAKLLCRFVESLKQGFEFMADNDDAPGSSDLWSSLPEAEPDDDVADDSEAGSTSDEDEDGHPKPAYGVGKLGWGPPLRSKLMGRLRWFADGHGLASPGRWPPDRRPSGANDRDLLLHKELMDDLLRLLSESLDVKREVCRLATGHAKASPFPPELIKAGRDLVFKKLQGAGSRETLDRVPERQPFYLETISELLRFAGDPDWRRYTKASWSFSAGVPLGVDVRLPRTPALFFRKTKHRKFVGAAEQLSDEPRLNYPSAREHELKIEEQFAKEISLGAMI
ncbi:unnamed protein product, partial [Symbiodinium microadriaticum]